MSLKYKLLKIVREVGSTTKAVGPSMTKLRPMSLPSTILKLWKLRIRIKMR